MFILRVIRHVLDWLSIAMMLLIVSISLGALGNLPFPGFASSFVDWREGGGFMLWTLIPLATTLLTFKTRRWASCASFLCAALVFVPSPLYHLLIGLVGLTNPNFLLEVFVAFFPAQGLYWLFTSALGCPPVLGQGSQPSKRRRWAFNIGGVLVCSLGLMWTAIMAAIPFWAVDCGRIEPFAKPIDSQQAVFIATDVLDFVPAGTSGSMSSSFLASFAIARVQKHYWGLPWWDRKFLFIARFSSWRGEPYLVDANLPYGFLSRFLPIVTLRQCGRSDLVRDANVELRVLKDGQSQKGARIIGQILHFAQGTREQEAGIRVTISGPNGNIVTTTDGKGIFDAPGLAPGTYSVQPDLPPKARCIDCNCMNRFQLAPGEIRGCDMDYD